MNIGNITSDNFNLDGNGKDIQIEVYEQLIEQLQQENKQLKDNWNKLRETLKSEQLGSILYSDKKRFADIDEILLKMQELEKGDGNE